MNTADTDARPGPGDGRGLLVVMSGPSGVGKTTLAEGVLASPGFSRAVTATTRAPRPGEVDGRDYHFLDQAEFRRRVEAGEFLEHALVHGNLYGTPASSVEAVVARGDTCLLVIDVQGAATLRAAGVEALYLFVEPPSMAELERRLRTRETESEEQVQGRLGEARSELARRDQYDAAVVNDDVETAIGHIRGLAASRRAGSR